MKKFLLITVLITGLFTMDYGLAFSQVHNRDVITIQTGADLYFGEAATNEPGGTINNSGTLHLKGDFTNNGTATINSTVMIDGSGNQSINGISTFEIVDVAKTGGTATVTSGTSSVTDILRMTSGTMNANGNVVIVSNASGTGLVDDFTVSQPPGTLSGNIRVQRYIDAAPIDGFHHIGSPVNTPSVATQLSELSLYGTDNVAVTPQPTCNPLALDPSSNYGNLFDWRENGPFSITGCQQDGWYVRTAGTMTNGRGYAAIVFGAPTTLEITGVANTSAFTPVSYPNLSLSNPTGNGWQLVSNPFPSPIEWGVIPAGFDSQANFWQDGGYYSGTYQSITPATHPGYQIGSMQGFFVRTTGTNQNFVLQQSHRRVGDPPFFFEIVNNKLELVIEGNGFADRTNLYFTDEGPTNNIDSEFDAWKMLSNGNQPTLYTVTEGEKISINALQLTGHPNTIPMGLISGTAGSYTITAHDLNTFDMASQIFLEDLQQGVIQNLFTDPVYTFTADPNDNPARFLLHFNLSGQTTGIQGQDGNSVAIYGYGSSVNMMVNFERPQTGVISIYNMQGQEIYTERGSFMGRHEIKLNGIAAGSYIVRASFENDTYTERVILAEQ
jgi:hypothetical protein